MSLLSDAMTDCIRKHQITVDDGYGGQLEPWIDGAKIKCAIVPNVSTQVQIAKQQGLHEIYTITTSKSVTLNFHDVIQQLSDGKVFRVTSDGDDTKTPESATVDMRQVTAEEFKLG